MDNPFESPSTLPICHGYGGLERGLERNIGPTFPVAYLEIEAFLLYNLAAQMEQGFLDPRPLFTDAKEFAKIAPAFRNKIHGISAGYPCFPKGSMVLTKKGYKSIEVITTSDYVLTHRGRWRKVTAVHNSGIAKIREIKAQGVIVKTTDDHPFYARFKGRLWNNERRSYDRVFGKPMWNDASSLSKDHFLGQILPTQQKSSKYSKDFWWLIGRYIADGWSQWSPSRRHKKGGRITICCDYSEASELEKGINAAGFKAYKSEERTVVKFAITRHWLYEFVQQFGNGASKKTINQTILELPTDKARAFMDGYISGDGSYEKSHGKYPVIKFTSTSHSLALGLSLLAQRTHGVVTTISESNRPKKHKIEGRVVNQNKFWEVSIPQRNKSGFIEEGYGWKKIRSNQYVGEENVYNITVEEDRSYIVNGAIVHNCPGESKAGLRNLWNDPRFLWPYIRRTVRATNPFWVWFENVEAHLSGSYPIVQRSLQNMGFAVETSIHSAFEAGAPHLRKRVFILGINMEIANSVRWRRWIDETINRKWEMEAQRSSLMADYKDLGREKGNVRSGNLQEQPGLKHASSPGELAIASNGNERYGHEEIQGTPEEAEKTPRKQNGKRRRSEPSLSHTAMANNHSEGLEAGKHHPSHSGQKLSSSERSGPVSNDRSGGQQESASEGEFPGIQEFVQFSSNWPTKPGYPQNDWEEPRTVFSEQSLKVLDHYLQKYPESISERQTQLLARIRSDRAAKPGMGCTINGHNFREDFLRAYGNGVVEQTGELASYTCLQKHLNNLRTYD